jgi:lipoprotein signal peptidase
MPGRAETPHSVVSLARSDFRRRRQEPSPVRESRHLTALARIALLVTAGDLATKAAATALLTDEATWFASWLHFAVVHNNQGAFGWSVGVYTWQLNLALTLSAIVFMIPVTRDLARIDPHAPRALGLIVGGALGNLASLVTSSRGVVDFIQISFETSGIALNVADVAAYAGLGMILRTGALLVVALRDEARLREPARTTPVRSVFAEREVMVRPMGAEPQRAAGTVAREVTVLDFNRVGRPSLPRDDAPAVERDDVQEVRVRGRVRGIVGRIDGERLQGASRAMPPKADTRPDAER